MTARVDSDRNLLLGILAVQMDFVTRDALFEAMKDWVYRKETPLGALLVEKGDLAQSRQNLLEALVDEHVKAHGGEPARSLQVLSSIGSVVQDLGQLTDPDLQASVGHLKSVETLDPFATGAPTNLGQPTSWNGRFRVVRPHASGGLGVVSVAMDDELDREVAFKEIKDRYADDLGSQARFVLEAEITGKLEHPGIIPIYGLGHDLAGRPFYAMRFIRGDSLADAINRYHDPAGPFLDPTRRSLQLRELLGRFLDVCDALAYAHSRGVLHRDLKPGNIMLGPFGETLVVDWGLALPLDHIPEGHESTHSPVKSTKADSGSLPREQGAAVGTPAYMSPEQAEGAIEKLGPRSDVYGLGAILYDLLTGKRPIEGTTLEELLRHVGQGKIQPPRQHRPEIPAPLEAICLKALALNPEDRYASPRALAKDIKAWLADEPVSARREPFTERARRWAKKHRTAVTAAVATLLMGLVGLGAVAAVQTKANRELTLANAALDKERIKAQSNEAQALAAVKKFGEVIANEPELKKNQALDGLRKRLLNEPLAFFLALRERLLADHDTRPESLVRLADASFELAYLTNEIGDKQDAIVAYRESLSIRQKLASDNPTATKYQSGLARNQNNIAILLSETGQSDEALNAYQSTLMIFQKIADYNPTDTQIQMDLALIQNNIGRLLSSTGKVAEALTAYKSALMIQQKIADANPSVTEFQTELARSLGNLGALLSDSGQSAEALKVFQSALKIQQKIAQANPTVTQFQSALAQSHHNIGLELSDTGQSAEALNAYQSALMIRQKIADDNPAVIMFQSDLADSQNNIGLLLSSTGKVAEALTAYKSALMIRQKLADANPSVNKFQSALATIHNNIGNLLSDTGQSAEALNAYQSALMIRQKLADDNLTVTKFQSELADSHNNIGNLLSDTGQSAEALTAYHFALKIRQKIADANPTVTKFQSDLAQSHQNIGVLLCDTGQLSDALTAHKSALMLQQKLADANPTVTKFQSDLADSLYNIGNLRSITGQSSEALNAYKSALVIQQKLVQEHPESHDFASKVGSTLNNVAIVELYAKKFDEACINLREAVIWQRKAMAANPANPTYRELLTQHWSNLVKSYRGLGDSDGVNEAEREITILRESDPTMLVLDAQLAAILQGTQKPEDNSQRLQLAQRAYEKALFVAAAKLWAEALIADPKVAEDRQAQIRYNAACVAALASCGEGKDVPAPDQAAKAKLREQARVWLQAELAAWAKLLESDSQAKPTVIQTLQHWKEDTDLDGVRDPKGLPECEREPWRVLWSEVDALLAKAQAGSGPVGGK